MKLAHQKPKKKVLKTFTRRVGLLISVVFFAFFISLSPLLVDFGPNPTGIYLQKVSAKLCYNGVVEAGREDACRENNDNLQQNKCYNWSGGDRQGNGRGYSEVACPVPPSFEPDREPVCTSQSGNRVDCPPSAQKAQCYTLGGRQGNSLDSRICTVRDVPSYNPFTTASTEQRNQQQARDPECYNAVNKKVECPANIKNNAGSKGKCYQQNRANAPFNEVTCSTVQAAAAAQTEQAAVEAQNSESCEERALLSSGWIVCSLLELLSSGVDGMISVVDSLLNVDATRIGNDDELQAIWSYFRVIATFALLAIGLVMVISQAIGGNR